MTAILGISAWYHDSAAALIVDGRIAAACQEERFTRVKHDARFPEHAVAACLAEAGLQASDLDMVVFYEKPLLKFERLLETYLAYSPAGFRSFLQAMPQWLRTKLFIPQEIRSALPDYDGPVNFATHHESHAASAFLASPFEEAAIVTLDGVGEWSTTTWGVGRGAEVDLKQEIRFPHSLGLFYSAMTYYTGFRVNSGEYKVMGLAPYGEPKYLDLFLEHVVDLRDDGSFWLDQSYFNYCQGLTMTGGKFHELMGGPPRPPESELTQKEMDIAASVQALAEEVMLRIARHVQGETGMKNLCLAGGVALNCVGNGRILREGPFDRLWIQPAAGDAGGALGAALLGWHRMLGNGRTAVEPDRQEGSYLGPAAGDDAVAAFVAETGAVAERIPDEDELARRVAELLDDGKVVGHLYGRMEFGPRALGHRSILGDPRNTAMQRTMNLKIKYRESFRPFAPSCLEERTNDYFELDTPSPYMLLVAGVQPDRRQAMTEQECSFFGIEKLNVVRSDIPAITHVDYSARVQSVHHETSPRYHRLIKAFEERTGCGLVVNTSFNVRGEPIVSTPEDAWRCFMYTEMDALVLENHLLLKVDQAPLPGAEEYKSQFKLD